MNVLRASSLTIRRHHLWHSRRSYTTILWNDSFQSVNGRRRRRFSDFSSQAPRFISPDQKDLERFTVYALDSRIVPLGTMSDELWEETVVAIKGWFRVRGGFGLDSAGRLIERLDAELAIRNRMTASFHKKSNNLSQLHNSLLNQWLETYTNYPHSNLALVKANNALQRVIVWQADNSEEFPIDELIVVVEGWLNLGTDEASRNAAGLLLFATDYTNDFQNIIGPYLEKARANISWSSTTITPDVNDIYSSLIEKIELLKDSGDALDLQEVPSQNDGVALAEDGLEKSGLESEEMKMQLIDLIKKATIGNQLALEALSDGNYDVDLLESLFETFLHEIDPETANPKSIVAVMEVLEVKRLSPNLQLYQNTIQALFKFEKDALDEISIVYSHVLDRVQKGSNSAHEFPEFLYSVLAMYTYRNLYVQAGDCLFQAEKAFLSENPSEGETSIIPLKCYERMIVRKWITNKTAPWVQKTFQRLLELYQSGYLNLLPTASMFAAYIRAHATMTNNANEIEKILDEMVKLYEATGDESCKPNAEIFNTVLLAYKQDTTLMRGLGKKSMQLLNRMESLKIQPDTKSLNFVIQSVNKSIRNNGAYPMVCELFDKFNTYGLEPDTFSRHGMLDACGFAGPKNRDPALKSALETFGDIRKHNQVGQLTYQILTKVLKQTLSKGPTSDKVASQTFLLCCNDGFLEPKNVKKAFKSLISPNAWDQAYTRNLMSDGQEPPEWSRNVTKKTSKN